MVSSVGWTVAVAEDETMSTRSPEPRAGDEKDEEAMGNGEKRRGKGRYSKFEDRVLSVVRTRSGWSVVVSSRCSDELTSNSAGPAALGTKKAILPTATIILIDYK